MSAVPKLRFPEFDGEWVRCNVGDFCSFSKGKGISKSDIAEDGALPCIRYGELYTHYGVKIDEVASRTNVPVEALVLSKGGEVIIPASGETPEDISTAAVVMDCGVALGGDLNILRTKSDGYFLASYISGKARLRLASMAQGNSVVHLYGAQIASLEMCLPRLPEQQKIASFLSSVDKKIDLLRQKRHALELYKKGLMQKIFSQEIRFKQDDGSDFPDWEEVYADEILKTVSNKNHDGTEKIVSISQTGGAVYRDQNGIDIIASEESVKNYKIIEPGDFVISLRSFQGGIEYSEIRGICSPAYTIMNPTVDLDTSFFRTFFKTGDFIKRLSLTVVGIRDGKQISFGAFSTVPLPFPSVPEQKKIASFLFKIDEKIQNASSQIEQMETFKKGLLQQMFV